MTALADTVTVRAATAEDVADIATQDSAIIDADNIASQCLFASFGFHHTETDLNYFEPNHPQQRWIKTRAEAIQTEKQPLVTLGEPFGRVEIERLGD